jgi:hypothetical protein
MESKNTAKNEMVEESKQATKPKTSLTSQQKQHIFKFLKKFSKETN